VASEEKVGRLKQLMDSGKEKGYVLYDEVNELLTDEFPGGRELDDLLSELDTAGVEILEEPKIEFDKKLEEGDEPNDLELVQDFSDKTNDPLRMYLREMGTVPLLTREGEIELAKRIERGQAAVRKSLSRSALVIREILALAEMIQRDPSTVRDILVMPDLVVTDESVVSSRKSCSRPWRKSKNTTRKPSSSGRSCRPSRAA
jgi:RNA polymerase primary sigma factor